MSCDSQTEQQIWELIYGVLPPDQATEILRRISSDPDVARAYSRIKLLAEVVAEGAKLDADVELRSVSLIALSEESLIEPGEAARRRSLWQLAAEWSLAAAALCLVALTGTGWWLTQRSSPATGRLIASREAIDTEVGGSRFEMAMPSRISEDQSTLILVSSRDALDRPLASGVELKVLDPDQGLLWQGTRHTDPATGILTDTISGSELTDHSKMESARAASLPVPGGPLVTPQGIPLPGLPPSQLADRGVARPSASGLLSAAPEPAPPSSPQPAKANLAAPSGRMATKGVPEQVRSLTKSQVEADPNATATAASSGSPEALNPLAAKAPGSPDAIPRAAASNRSLPAADAVTDAIPDPMPGYRGPVTRGEQGEDQKNDPPATGKSTSPRLALSDQADRSRLTFQARTDSGETITATAEWQHDTDLTYVTLDRETYRPGEVVFFRSVTLSRSRLIPADQRALEVSIRHASGQPIPELTTVVESHRGVAEGQLRLPAELPEGRYFLVARSPLAKFPTLERRFVLKRSVAAPSARGAESASRGDGTSDTGSLDPAAGASPPADAARPAGETVPQPNDQPASVPPAAPAQPPVPLTSAAKQPSANASSRDDAPAAENPSAGTGPQAGPASDLPSHVNPAGNSQTDPPAIAAAATDPKQRDAKGTQQVPLSSADDGLGLSSPPLSAVTGRVQFYPESGILVAGVPNRVYFTATTDHGQPTDQHLELVDGTGRVITAGVLHRAGLGSFTWTPQASQTYWLRTSGIGETANAFSVPPCDPAAEVTLQADPSVIAAGAPLVVRLKSRLTPQRLLVQVNCRGETVALAVVRATDFQTSRQRLSDSHPPLASQPLVMKRPHTNSPGSEAASAASQLAAESEASAAAGLLEPQQANRSVQLGADDLSTKTPGRERNSANPSSGVKPPVDGEPAAEEARLADDDSSEKRMSESARASAIETLEEPAWMQAEVTLPLSTNAAGVLRLTVFELGSKSPRPLAERLVYRHPQQQLRISLDDLSERHEPGSEVTFRIRTYDAWLRPVATQLGATIVAGSHSLQATGVPSDNGNHAEPRLAFVASSHFDALDQFFLGFEDRWGKPWAEPESWESRIGVVTPLRFLASADLVSSTTSDQHAEVLDAVLATAGWRRFVIGPALGTSAERVNPYDSPPGGADLRPGTGALSSAMKSDRSSTVANSASRGAETDPQATPMPLAGAPAGATAAAPPNRLSSGSGPDRLASEQAGRPLDATNPTMAQASGGRNRLEPVTDLPLFLTYVSIQKTLSEPSGNGKRFDGLAASRIARRWGPFVVVLSLLLLSLIAVVRGLGWLPNLRWGRPVIASSLVTLLIGVFWSFQAQEPRILPAANFAERNPAGQPESSQSGYFSASDEDGEHATQTRTASEEPTSSEPPDEMNRSSDIAVDVSDSPASDQHVTNERAEMKQPLGQASTASLGENRATSAARGSGLADANSVAGNQGTAGGGREAANQAASGRSDASLEQPANRDRLAIRNSGSAALPAVSTTATNGTVYYREFAVTDEWESEGPFPARSWISDGGAAHRPASANSLVPTADAPIARPVNAAPASSILSPRPEDNESPTVRAADDRSRNADLDVVPAAAARNLLNSGEQRNPAVTSPTAPPSLPSTVDAPAATVAAGQEFASDTRLQLWFPRLATSISGETTFTIRLPDQPGRYWLRLDGHTLDGRVGSLLQHIDVGSAPSE